AMHPVFCSLSSVFCLSVLCPLSSVLCPLSSVFLSSVLSLIVAPISVQQLVGGLLILGIPIERVDHRLFPVIVFQQEHVDRHPGRFHFPSRQQLDGAFEVFVGFLRLVLVAQNNPSAEKVHELRIQRR